MTGSRIPYPAIDSWLSGHFAENFPGFQKELALKCRQAYFDTVIVRRSPLPDRLGLNPDGKVRYPRRETAREFLANGDRRLSAVGRNGPDAADGVGLLRGLSRPSQSAGVASDHVR